MCGQCKVNLVPSHQGTWPEIGYDLDYMVIAGGGAGGGAQGGGGGAGGYRASGYGPSPLQGSTLFLKPGAHAITIGAGGAGTPGNSIGGPGSTSVF